MTPREIIHRHIDFADPARIGFDFYGEGRLCDILFVKQESLTWNQRRWVEGRYEYFDDEWGNVWQKVNEEGAGGGEIYQPALGDWAMLKDYRLPDMGNPARYVKVREIFAKRPDHYHIGGLPGFPFAICRYLRKMEIYFQDLLLEREHIDELHARVAQLLEEMICQYALAGADAVMFAEDWGIQDRLLIHPNMWREIFKPLFARLCGAAHARGLSVFMHSCGYNWEILDDLAQVGINVLQFDQPCLYGLERLAKKLQHNRVVLFSPVDIQRVWPTGDRKLITDTARDLCKLFGGPHGGFIARTYGDLKGIGVDPQWEQWAYDAFIENQSKGA